MRIGEAFEAASRTTMSLAALEQVLPAELIASTLIDANKVAARRRKLPPDVVLRLVVAMGLLRGLSIENVLRKLRDGLEGALSWGISEIPHSSSITEARDKLGWEVVRSLFQRLAARLRSRHEEAASWRGLEVNVIDGTCFLSPDTPENEAEFGRPPSWRGGAKSAFPALRGVFVLGARTHLVAHAAFGNYRQGELTLAYSLLPDLKPGTLLVMDRAYYAYRWLTSLSSAGVHFVVRADVSNRMKPQKVRRILPNDAHGVLVVPKNFRKVNPGIEVPPQLEVRIVTFSVKTRSGRRTVKVVTSLMDAKKYPAAEIAQIYAERWEGELGYREVKTHQVGTRVTFRSHTPDRVRQEAWGLVTAYNCVRALIAEAAETVGLDPRRLSFVDALERVRSALTLRAPESSSAVHDRLLIDIAFCVLQKRRSGRNCPRAVKIKMSKYPRKRPRAKALAAT